MSSDRGPRYLMTFGFLAVIAAVAPLQAVSEIREGDAPQALDLFRHVPNARALRSFEKDLEGQSIVAQAVQPRMRYVRFRALGDAGEKAILGRQGWWFYRPDVRYLIERCPDDLTAKTGPEVAVAAIVAFRDQLAQRGIQLLVIPVPGKPSVYPDKMTRLAVPGDPRVHEHTRRVIEALTAARVETVDLFEVFAKVRTTSRPADLNSWYLARDSHWTNDGARLAAEAVARHIRSLDWISPGTVRYDERSTVVRRTGDIVRMLKCPPIEALFEPEQVQCRQVVRAEDGKPYRDDLASPILVMGDSFLRIYEHDEPTSAGFIAHLARELSQPLTSIVSDGGASTLVRQELSRKPALLAGKKLVIWEFVERDIRFGMEGWQDVRFR